MQNFVSVLVDFAGPAPWFLDGHYQDERTKTRRSGIYDGMTCLDFDIAVLDDAVGAAVFYLGFGFDYAAAECSALLAVLFRRVLFFRLVVEKRCRYFQSCYYWYYRGVLL